MKKYLLLCIISLIIATPSLFGECTNNCGWFCHHGPISYWVDYAPAWIQVSTDPNATINCGQITVYKGGFDLGFYDEGPASWWCDGCTAEQNKQKLQQLKNASAVFPKK